tara:strand:+ start:510 stop:656 length:147 start_codon:yes stop_codon:yes gene_type:complete
MWILNAQIARKFRRKNYLNFIGNNFFFSEYYHLGGGVFSKLGTSLGMM